MKDIAIVAHRGASSHEPENSIASFEKAIELGARTIEMDVRTTFDGHAILMHDETLDRTTDGVGKVPDSDMKFIASLRLRNGQTVPILSEVLESLRGRCTFILELKDHFSAAAAGKAVKDLKLWKDVVFSSFNGPWLVDLKLRYPDARVAFISEDRKQDSIRITSSLYAEAIHIGYRITSRKLVMQAHESGLKAFVWTVNSPRRMRKCIEMGADGIITDRPDVLANLLRDVRLREP